MNCGIPTDSAASRPRPSRMVALRSLLWLRIGVVAVRDTKVAISKQMVSIPDRMTSAVTGSTFWSLAAGRDTRPVGARRPQLVRFAHSPPCVNHGAPFRASTPAPSSSGVPSTRMGVPFTTTWRTPDGLVGDQALAVGREVADAVETARPDGGGVEHGDVGGLALGEHAAVVEPEHAGGLAR